MMTIATIAAGSAIQKFTRNLSFIAHPCVEVAAIVVSEIKLKLSPNIAPPITEATQKGTLNPAVPATSIAIGVTTAIVPTDVPMAVETKAATTKSTTTANCAGIKSNKKYAAAEALERPRIPAKIPAQRKMRIMRKIFLSPMAPAIIFIFLSKLSLRFWMQATKIATRKAPTIGML